MVKEGGNKNPKDDCPGLAEARSQKNGKQHRLVADLCCGNDARGKERGLKNFKHEGV